MRPLGATARAVLVLVQVAGVAALVGPCGLGVPAGQLPAMRRLLAATGQERCGGGAGEPRGARVWGASAAALVGAGAPVLGLGGALMLRLRGGKKGTASMGKRGTGGHSHPSYKYNMSYKRISRHQTSKRKRYCIKKNPERTGRCKHLRLVNRRFKHGFRCAPPYTGPADAHGAQSEA